MLQIGGWVKITMNISIEAHEGGFFFGGGGDCMIKSNKTLYYTSHYLNISRTPGIRIKGPVSFRELPEHLRLCRRMVWIFIFKIIRGP